MELGKCMWQPSLERKQESALGKFGLKTGRLSVPHLQATCSEPGGASSYMSLYQWSITDLGGFWGEAAKFLDLKFQVNPISIYNAPPSPYKILGAKWFIGAKLNYAQNIIVGIDSAVNSAGAKDQKGHSPANERLVLVAYGEGASRRTFTAEEIKNKTMFCQGALKEARLVKGEPVAAVVANVPEAIIAMLGVTSLGGVWSSCSPDFGADGIVDRFAQLNPRILFATRRYVYAGKSKDMAPIIAQVKERIPSLVHIIWISHLDHQDHIDPIEHIDQQEHMGRKSREIPPTNVPHGSQTSTAQETNWHNWLARGQNSLSQDATLEFVPCEPDDPLFVMFSSGTTGLPKCIVHGVLGTLLQHKKEHQLHCDMGPGDRLLYYTTCGWMMWNWMVSALASGVSLVLYEGAVQRSEKVAETPVMSDYLWQVVARENVTVFGTSPKFISFAMEMGHSPKDLLSPSERGLPHLKTLLSTGAPLMVAHYHWIYDKVASDLHLASISGGTDIISCFMLGNPLTPVYAGEIQGPGLGMAIEAWNEAGERVYGTKGELVCTKPFPSMPLGFWNDLNQEKYRKAYFEAFKDQEVWHHGDYIEITLRNSVIVYGRSDATLNPGGIRIGSAEIYRQVEALPEIADSLVVGVREGDDTPMALFIKLKSEVPWSKSLEQRIINQIRLQLTPRHVPKWTAPVTDIPYTRSGKKMEVAVTQVVNGEKVVSRGSIANPDSLLDYQMWAEQNLKMP